MKTRSPWIFWLSLSLAGVAAFSQAPAAAGQEVEDVVGLEGGACGRTPADEGWSDCDGNGVDDACDLEDLDTLDCQGNGVPDRCDVSLGTSADRNFDGRPDECELDCNGNGLPDDFDLSGGKSLDLDADGRPDECAPDCNGNGLPDAFDLAQGLSADCQENGVPDECDVKLGASLDGGSFGNGELSGDGVPDECQPRCEGVCEGRAARTTEDKPYPIVYSFEEAPIPAGFFSPDSQPFGGSLEMVGQPLDPKSFGLADLLLQRSADPFRRDDPPGDEGKAVDLEVRGLMWRSLLPVTVREGTTARSWTVEATLSPARPSKGRLEAVKTHPGGGHADLELALELRFVFRRLEDPLEVRVLDAPEQDRSPFRVAAAGIPWLHDLSPAFATAFPDKRLPATKIPGDDFPGKKGFDPEGDFFLGVAPGVLLGPGTSLPVLAEAEMGQLCTVLCAVPAPKLEIFNGLEGACKDPKAPGPCGGQRVVNKVAAGAVTVANLNDTDGDGKLDRDDGAVLGVGGKGRDEVDLMKIVIDVVPNPKNAMTVDLAVTGDARIWDAATKGGRGRAKDSFQTKDLPKTLWIEARSPSTTLRDLGVSLTFAGQTDSAKATAVWAELSEVRRTRTGLRAGNSIPGDLAGTLLAGTIEGFRSAAGSRYGIGTFRARQGRDVRVGGRILFELTTRPQGAEALGVRWDMARQVFGRDRELRQRAGRLTPVAALPDIDFPEQGAPAKDIELLTDPVFFVAESDTPRNQHIYSFDTPSGPVEAGLRDFAVRRSQFREWARVRIGPNFFVDVKDTVEGSRASPFIPWSLIDYLRRGRGDRLVPDTRNPSASEPVRFGTGDGTLQIDVLASAQTESFAVAYRAGTWTLTGSASAAVTSVLQEPVARGGQWVLLVPAKVRVTITQGAQAFKAPDNFIFSTFKAKADGAKQNLISLGAIDPKGEG